MIISASRRTDIPAFYAPWFFNRLQEGYLLVPNPFDPRTLSRISLGRDVVDWIGDAEPFSDADAQASPVPRSGTWFS